MIDLIKQAGIQKCRATEGWSQMGKKIERYILWSFVEKVIDFRKQADIQKDVTAGSE